MNEDTANEYRRRLIASMAESMFKTEEARRLLNLPSPAPAPKTKRAHLRLVKTFDTPEGE